MPVFKATADISRGVSQVFAIIADIDNEPQWREGVQGVTLVQGEPGTVGLTYKEKITRMGFDLEMDVEITEFETDRRLAYRFAAGPFSGDGSYEITPNGEGCTVLATIDLGGGMIAKAMGSMAGSQLDNDLERLKTLVEGS